MEERNDVPMVTNYQTEEYEKVSAAVIDSKDNPDDPIVQVARRNDVSRKQLIRGRAVLGCAINPVLDEYRMGRLSLTTAAELAALPGGLQEECFDAMRYKESSSIVIGLLQMLYSRSAEIARLQAIENANDLWIEELKKEKSDLVTDTVTLSQRVNQLSNRIIEKELEPKKSKLKFWKR